MISNSKEALAYQLLLFEILQLLEPVRHRRQSPAHDGRREIFCHSGHWNTAHFTVRHPVCIRRENVSRRPHCPRNDLPLKVQDEKAQRIPIRLRHVFQQSVQRHLSAEQKIRLGFKKGAFPHLHFGVPVRVAQLAERIPHRWRY